MLPNSNILSKKNIFAGRQNKSQVQFNAPPELDNFLKDCHYYISVKVEESALADDRLLLGVLQLKLADPFQDEILKQGNEIWLYISDIPGRSFIYSEWLEVKDDCRVKEAMMSRIVESTDVSFLAGTFLTRVKRQSNLLINFVSDYNPGKIVQFSLVPVTDETLITLKVFIFESMMIPSEDFSAEISINKGMQALMKHLYAVEVPRMKFTKQIEDSVEHISFLYSNVKSYHEVNWDAASLVDVQNSQLKVALRPYQINSVNWMLQREHLLGQSISPTLHPLYSEITLPTGEQLYYNKYVGNFAKEKPYVKPPPTGGILADEMGLGKTVEVLACVMANQRHLESDGQEMCTDQVKFKLFLF